MAHGVSFAVGPDGNRSTTATARGVVTALFDKLEDAGVATQLIFKGGIIPTALELMDRAAIQAVQKYRPELNLVEAEAMLLIEIEGQPAGVAETAATVAKLPGAPPFPAA